MTVGLRLDHDGVMKFFPAGGNKMNEVKSEVAKVIHDHMHRTADEIADKLLERFDIKLLEPAQRETVQQAAERGFRECKP